jgi:hypothetical protein
MSPEKYSIHARPLRLTPIEKVSVIPPHTIVVMNAKSRVSGLNDQISP